MAKTITRNNSKACNEQSFTPSLPLEIIDDIISHIPRHHTSQPTLYACTLISRTWYHATIARLYENPRITGPNYDSFVKAVCPSINQHIRKNGLAELVKTLDLGALVHHGSKSLTARLLGRVKGNLERFVAPQASFGINSLAALSKCARLRHLDLSLVSEAFTPSELSHSLRKLLSLETLLFPRAGRERYEMLFSCWPDNLQTCIITGGLKSGYHIIPGVWTDRNRDGLYVFPKRQPHNLTRLIIGNCDQIMTTDISSIVSSKYLPRLELLKIVPPMEQLLRWPIGSERGIHQSNPLACSNIRQLDIPIDFISRGLLDSSHPEGPDHAYTLDTLHLRFIESSKATYPVLGIDIIFDAVAEGPFKNLRRLTMPRRLQEELNATLEADQIDEYLKALAREDGKKAKYTEEEAGIRISAE